LNYLFNLLFPLFLGWGGERGGWVGGWGGRSLPICWQFKRDLLASTAAEACRTDSISVLLFYPELRIRFQPERPTLAPTSLTMTASATRFHIAPYPSPPRLLAHSPLLRVPEADARSWCAWWAGPLCTSRARRPGPRSAPPQRGRCFDPTPPQKRSLHRVQQRHGGTGSESPAHTVDP
jgi:hypothetical protein